MAGKKGIRVYFTMDEELYKKFEEYIEKNTLDKSKLLEKMIIKFLEEIKK
ncbi:ribbon-helix-helix domain-containing protein [Methanoculleus sp.]|jgi:metal-responsive CopG/Arc/MetJ family transcriptional regulator|nr:ribbon-helix-helix domain-containing protein [Methanoculleus sp.]MCK9319390.1 ribbon-helix-helix domain-containing protein [Methanoculleus sp.]